MNIRYNSDPDTGMPHIFQHGISESDVMDVLRDPIEARPGSNGSTVLIGRTFAGRILRVIVLFDEDGKGVFVITAYDVEGKPLSRLRRRMRRKGHP